MRRVAATVLALVVTSSGLARAEPMECTEDSLRMALGHQGLMPSELLRACLRITQDMPDYGITQYMISVHFRRLRKIRTAAVFLERASRIPPLAADPRTLYLLAQYQIASGFLEQGLVAKDRFLSNSGDLSPRERVRRTRNLYRLLETIYELRAADAEDDEPRVLAETNWRFYREARIHMDRSLEEVPAGVVQDERPLLGPGALPPIEPPSLSSKRGPRGDPPPA